MPRGRAALDRFGPLPGQPELVIDRACQGDAIRGGPTTLATSRSCRSTHRARPWHYDPRRYHSRNQVERFSFRLKCFRHISTRPKQLDVLFLAFIHLAVFHDAP